MIFNKQYILVIGIALICACTHLDAQSAPNKSYQYDAQAEARIHQTIESLQARIKIAQELNDPRKAEKLRHELQVQMDKLEQIERMREYAHVQQEQAREEHAQFDRIYARQDGGTAGKIAAERLVTCVFLGITALVMTPAIIMMWQDVNNKNRRTSYHWRLRI